MLLNSLSKSVEDKALPGFSGRFRSGESGGDSCIVVEPKVIKYGSGTFEGLNKVVEHTIKSGC